MKITNKDIKILSENIIKRLIKEDLISYEDDQEEEVDYFLEYENGYPNEDFIPENITSNDLIKFCRSFGDFYYIYQGLKGWTLMTATTSNQVNSIVNDLTNCSLTITHKFDYLIENKLNFEYDYIAVFNIKTSDENYYIVYEQPK